jgi:hypothetical protein
MTLEQAYTGNQDGPLPEYRDLRAKAKTELIEWAVPFLKNGDLHAEPIIEAAIQSAEEMGRVRGNAFSGEIAGRYTSSGNPLTF